MGPANSTKSSVANPPNAANRARSSPPTSSTATATTAGTTVPALLARRSAERAAPPSRNRPTIRSCALPRRLLPSEGPHLREASTIRSLSAQPRRPASGQHPTPVSENQRSHRRGQRRRLGRRPDVTIALALDHDPRRRRPRSPRPPDRPRRPHRRRGRRAWRRLIRTGSTVVPASSTSVIRFLIAWIRGRTGGRWRRRFGRGRWLDGGEDVLALPGAPDGLDEVRGQDGVGLGAQEVGPGGRGPIRGRVDGCPRP